MNPKLPAMLANAPKAFDVPQLAASSTKKRSTEPQPEKHSIARDSTAHSLWHNSYFDYAFD
jgi:hypothetical protein